MYPRRTTSSAQIINFMIPFIVIRLVPKACFADNVYIGDYFEIQEDETASGLKCYKIKESGHMG